MYTEFERLNEILDERWITETLDHFMMLTGPSRREFMEAVKLKDDEAQRKLPEAMLISQSNLELLNGQASKSVHGSGFHEAVKNVQLDLVKKKSTDTREGLENDSREFAIRQTFFDYGGNFTSRLASKTGRMWERKTKEHKISESTVIRPVYESVEEGEKRSTYMVLDVEEMETYDMYCYLNRQTIKYDIQTSGKEAMDRQLEEINQTFSAIALNITEPGSFFFRWTEQSLLNIYLDFLTNQKDAKFGTSEALCLFFNSIKLFASYFSLSIFKLVTSAEEKDCGPSCQISRDEEKFVITVINHLFNCGTVNTERLLLQESLQKQTLKLRDIYRDIMRMDNQNFINNFKKNIPFIDPQVETLLQLNEASVAQMKKIMAGDIKSPEFVVSLKPKTQVADHTECIGYRSAVEALGEVSRRESPYEKLVEVMNAVKQISLSIYAFFQQHQVDISLSLSSEELFPIILCIYKEMNNPELILDLLLCYSFLTDDLKLGQSGYYCNTLITAFHFVALYECKI